MSPSNLKNEPAFRYPNVSSESHEPRNYATVGRNLSQWSHTKKFAGCASSRPMQRRGQNQSDGRESNGGGLEQIGGPFEAAPWYIHDGAQTVDLYSSIGYKSQLESSHNWARTRTPKRSPKGTQKSPAVDVEYTADPPPPDEENGPPGPLEYHREISSEINREKMSVSDERFEPPVSESCSFPERGGTSCRIGGSNKCSGDHHSMTIKEGKTES